MFSTCSVVLVEPVLLAVTESEFARAQIPLRIRGMFDVVYSWLKTASVKQTGHNYALYEKGAKEEVMVRVGFPVSTRFENSESVQCFQLEAGRAAYAMHVGPYNELRRTYAQLESWCRQEQLQRSGRSWEIYGDWNEDVSKLETGVYFGLK